MVIHDHAFYERERLVALRELAILDTFPEHVYDNLVNLAAKVCDTPIAAISLVADNRTWSKSVFGLREDQRNCPREFSFCTVSVNSGESLFQIPDTSKHEYFAQSPLVVEEPRIAFYAAANLKTSTGYLIGTLCVLDKKPRELNQLQLETLRALGDQVVFLMENRAQLQDLRSQMDKIVSNSASQSEAYLRATLNSVDAGFLVMDRSGVITVGNDSATKLLGFEKASEVVGFQFDDVVKDVDGTLSKTKILSSAQKGIPLHSESRLQRKDLSTFPAEFWVSPVIFNGAHEGAVISFLDISGRRDRELALQNEREKLGEMIEKSKAAERDLARERDHLDQIFASSPAAMATWIGDELTFARVNDHYQSLFPGRDLVGRNLMNVCPELEGQGFDDFLRKVMHTGQPWFAYEMLAKLAPAVGQPTQDRYFNIAYLPMHNEAGQIHAVYHHSVEVTDAVVLRKQLEAARIAAEAANLAKSQFLANMSHEIRTPLGVVLGFVDVLSTGEPSHEDRNRLFDRIKANGAHLTSLVDDLLDLTKVEANQISIEVIDTDLQNLLEDIHQTFTAQAKDRQTNFRWKMDANLPRFLRTDPVRLQQILVNLIGNALKFTPAGGDVEVTAMTTDLAGKPMLEIRIKDTGPGMSEDQMAKLFQPFTQADISTTRKYGGSGLGLFVSRRLAKLLGGNVEIESSTVGKGSWLKVSVEAQPTADIPKFNRAKTNESAVTGNLQSLKVLVVDDSPDNRELVRNYLVREGAIASFAQNGREGIDLATSDDFAVVLMDIQMPVLDGNSAMKELKESGYERPVIALTAHAMLEERRHSLALGFSDYLVKPISRTTLIDAIQKHSGR